MHQEMSLKTLLGLLLSEQEEQLEVQLEDLLEDQLEDQLLEDQLEGQLEDQQQPEDQQPQQLVDQTQDLQTPLQSIQLLLNSQASPTLVTDTQQVEHSLLEPTQTQLTLMLQQSLLIKQLQLIPTEMLSL